MIQTMIRPNSSLAAEFWEFGKSASCPVYDMHGHMGAFCGIYFPRGETDDMVRSMDAAGVKLLCFAPHGALFCPERGNQLAVDAVRRYPHCLRAYLSVNPHYPEPLARDLAAFDGMCDVYVGLKLLPGYHGVRVDDTPFQYALEFANERALPVLLHTWATDPHNDAVTVRRVAERYPRITWFLGHSLNDHWHEAIAIAKDCPNTYLELTSVLGCRGVLELFVEQVGSERLLYGTDLPWFAEHQGIGAVLSAEISEDDCHNILHRNAERLLGIQGVEC